MLGQSSGPLRPVDLYMIDAEQFSAHVLGLVGGFVKWERVRHLCSAGKRLLLLIKRQQLFYSLPHGWRQGVPKSFRGHRCLYPHWSLAQT